MMKSQIEIAPFQDKHQADIDTLMTEIASEFADSIFPPKSITKQGSVVQLDKYWVALKNDVVIGTIGFSMLANNNIVLRRMFLNKSYRGQGVAQALLQTLFNSAIENNVERIFLGTMTQFEAAQKFYEKHGFTKISQAELPNDFPVNPVDKIFYKSLRLSFNPIVNT